MPVSSAERRTLEQMPRADREAWQLERLNQLLDTILPSNAFYAKKLSGISRPVRSLAELANWPLTTKDELIAAGDALGGATNRSWPIERYVRFHRTSGTRGRPLAVLDTADDWQWWLDGWQFVLDAAQVTPSDRVLMAFSFGPFIGFWSAFDAVTQRGALTIPTGGMSTRARLELLAAAQATVVLCTPSYALHLADVAAEHNIPLAKVGVRAIIVAGEPGGSIPAVRHRIEQAWGARVVDHVGATEVGPWGYADAADRGVYVNESQFIVEFLSPQTGQPAPAGEIAEVVLTTLGRCGCPVIRYRTGDLARPRRTEDARLGPHQNDGGNHFVFLEGGVLGRADDMLIVRGVNVFPSSIEQILREFSDVDEYRLMVRKDGAMDQLQIDVEDRQSAPRRIAEALELRLGLKVEVRCVPSGSLPRFEGKAQRLVRQP